MKKYIITLLAALFVLAASGAILINPYRFGTVVATKLEFSTQPGGGIDDVNFTTQPVVRAVNGVGTLDTSFTGTVTVAKINGAGTLSGTAAVAAVAGVATFTNLQLSSAGHHVLGASAGGLTSVRSGMMTVNPTATAVGAVRNFGGGTTSDVGDCGSGATIDNLGAGSFTVIVRIKRNSTGNNQFLASKYNTSNLGWYIQFDDTLETGDIVAQVNRTVNSTSYTNGSNVVSTSVWYDIAMTFDGSDGVRAVRIFKATVGAALAEISGYGAASVIGSGTAATDAAANLYIGNLQVAPTNPPLSDIAWVALFSAELTTDQMLTAQIGFNRADAAMITGIGNCAMLHRLNGTGTLTDLSGNGNSCAITGTTAGTGQTIYAPSVWANSIDATDSTDYLFTNSHSAVAYTTTATSAIISSQRTLDAAYNNQAAITVLVDGVYNTQSLVASIGKTFATVSMPGGSKVVSFVNGPRSRAVGSSPEGTFLTSVLFNASATEVIPATPTQNITFLADSILDDFLATPVGSNGAVSQFRQYLRTTHQVMIEGYGGATLREYAIDGTARAATVTKLARYNPTILFYELGANDYGAALWNASAFGSALDSLLVAINAEMPNTVIYVSSMVTRPAGEGANGAGSTAADYRTATSSAASGKSYCIFVAGPTQLWDGTNSDDASHPNNTGSAAILANLKTITGL